MESGATRTALRPGPKTTQSVADGIPTEDRGNELIATTPIGEMSRHRAKMSAEPGHVSIQPVDPSDDLINDLIARDAEFRQMLAKPPAGGCEPFRVGEYESPCAIAFRLEGMKFQGELVGRTRLDARVRRSRRAGSTPQFRPGPLDRGGLARLGSFVV